MPHEPAAPLGLRLLLADRYRVDARLLVPGARVDAVDTHAATGRRVRVACLEPDGDHDGDGAAARLAAWHAAHEAGLPVCRGLEAVDDDPGPLVVLEAPPGRRLTGDGAALAAQARLLAGALAERGLRAGAIPAGDLALDDAGGLVLAVPPPVAAAIDVRAEADRLAATVLAAVAAPATTDGPPGPGGAGGGVRLPGRRGLLRVAALAVAAAAASVLVGGGLRGGGAPGPDPAPAAPLRTAALTTPPPAAEPPPDPDPLPAPLRETAGSAESPRRPGPTPTRPRTRPVARPPAPAAPPPSSRTAVPTPRPPAPPSRGGALGPDSPFGPAAGEPG